MMLTLVMMDAVIKIGRDYFSSGFYTNSKEPHFTVQLLIRKVYKEDSIQTRLSRLKGAMRNAGSKSYLHLYFSSVL